MQTSPFSDLPSAALGGVDAPPAANAEKFVDDVVSETGAEARTGDARTNGDTSTQSTSGAFDDSQNAAGDMQDRGMASQPSAIPQFASHIDQTREDLRFNLEELESRMKAVTDWREHFRKRPGPMVIAALSAGLLLSALIGKR